MQNFSDIQEKVFLDCKNIISELNLAQSKEDLLLLEESVFDLEELITFLRVSENYHNFSTTSTLSEEIGNQQENLIIDEPKEELFQDKYIAEEEVIFNNELNEIEDSDIHHPEADHAELEEEAVFNNELNEIETSENFIFSNNEEPEAIENLENAKEELKVEEIVFEDKNNEIQVQISDSEQFTERGKIVEFTKEDFSVEKSEKLEELNEIAEEMQEKRVADHKFKLANIKGLKKVESLFDQDPLENIVEEKPAPTSGSLLKTNIPTDYMEAEKQKPEFKLDLNDKIAFSKMLFGGSQTELNETVNTLNTFKNMDEAKEYLSELYYQKNWEKVDEYAQRLWSLVENKFL